MMNTNTKMTDLALSTDTVFCQSLVATGMLTEAQMRRAAQRYRLGRSKDGGVVFWEIDEAERVRDGKIMYYRDDCHRDHDRHPDWVSSRMKQHYGYDGEVAIERCLFGLHLLSGEFRTESLEFSTLSSPLPIAVVEAEKTAVICSELFPQYVWMAAGGQSMLNTARLYPLRECRVVLFPDTDPDGRTYDNWHAVAEAAQPEFRHPIRVSRILEDHTTDEQKAAKIDIVDLMFSNNSKI